MPASVPRYHWVEPGQNDGPPAQVCSDDVLSEPVWSPPPNSVLAFPLSTLLACFLRTINLFPN